MSTLISRPTRQVLLAVVLLLTPLAGSPARAQELYEPARTPLHVKIIDKVWHDDARDRDVPVRIYLPQTSEGSKADAAAKLPVIIFSHGLWGSGRNYTYFGEHMAAQGYLVIAPTHAGSDTKSMPSALRMLGVGRGFGDAAPAKPPAADPPADNLRERLRGRISPGAAIPGDVPPPKTDAPPPAQHDDPPPGLGLVDAVDNPSNLRNRPKDISFVIDQLAKDEATKALADLTRVGVAGHSFGAYTAMAMGGLTVDLPEHGGGKAHSFRDERVKAVLPMSPEGVNTMGITSGSWDHFAVPVLFLTGTKDYGQGGMSAAWRRTGFEHVRGVDDYLLTINDAYHMTFANPNGGGAGVGSFRTNPVVDHAEAMIDSFATAFFDAYLRQDAPAKAWLDKTFAAKHDRFTAEFHAGKSEAAPAAHP